MNLGTDNLTKREYNDMMMTTDFWNKVKGKKILSFQNDSILIKGGIDKFLKYDYIGAIYNSTSSFWDVVSYTKGF